MTRLPFRVGLIRRDPATPDTAEPMMRALPAADYDEAIAEITALLKASSEIERHGHRDAQQPAGRLVEYALKDGTALTRSRR